MNVQDFVRDTLIQILEGVRDAQNDRGQTGENGIVMADRRPREVKFDIALVASDSTDAKGGVRVAGIGGEAASASEERSISRVKFEVAIILPSGR